MYNWYPSIEPSSLLQGSRRSIHLEETTPFCRPDQTIGPGSLVPSYKHLLPRTHLVDKQEKVFITSVQMSYENARGQLFIYPYKAFKHTFDTKSTDLIKMVAVYVCIYPE